jgi:tetratricopeptide (TPR) repeat protein
MVGLPTPSGFLRHMPLSSRVVVTCAAVMLGACLSLASVVAQADVLDDAEKLLRAGRFKEALALLEPLEDDQAGDARYDYLLARSALEAGNPSKASFVYERILAVEPNYVGVRLEMGRAYLGLGDYARAKLEFETVLSVANLPPDLRQQAQIYAKLAERYSKGSRVAGFGYVEAGFGYDTNIISATSRNPLIISGGTLIELPASSLERADNYRSLSAGGELQAALGRGFSLFFGGDARTRFHGTFDPADSIAVDARTGAIWAGGKHNVRVSALGGQYRIDSTRLRDSVGGAFDWRYLLNELSQVSLSLTGQRYTFDIPQLALNDFDLYQAALTYSRSVASGRGVVGVTALGGNEVADRRRQDGDKDITGMRLSLQYAVTEKVGLFASGGATWNGYRKDNPVFGTRRGDWLFDVTTGVTFGLGKGWSVRPQVAHIRNVSNLDLYDFNRTDGSINVRKDF